MALLSNPGVVVDNADITFFQYVYPRAGVRKPAPGVILQTIEVPIIKPIFSWAATTFR